MDSCGGSRDDGGGGRSGASARAFHGFALAALVEEESPILFSDSMTTSTVMCGLERQKGLVPCWSSRLQRSGSLLLRKMVQSDTTTSHERFAIYDMDSEDEEWVEKQNEKVLGEEDEQSQLLQQDTFELMIDGFEKCCFHSPADDLFDKKAATIASISYLGRQDVVEAVHDYWVRKRKQRKAPLLRVFQAHQAKKTILPFKPVFCKQRSVKRQGSQLREKSKQLNFEEQNIFHRVEEAKALADRARDIALHLMLVFPIVFYPLRINIDGLLFPSAPSLTTSNVRFGCLTQGLISVIFLGANFIPSIWDKKLKCLKSI